MKQIDLQAKLRETAKTGLESGTWFATVAENIGKEIFGTITRIFSYELEADDKRHAVSVRLQSDADFTVVIDKETTEAVEMKAGDLVLIPLSGQLKYSFDAAGVQPGHVVYLKYEGKDEEKKIRGNHPHKWTYNFFDPVSGEMFS